MKEIKTFFNSNNKLNKGYTKIASVYKNDNLYYRRKFQHVLPPIDIVAQYEELNPGTLTKLIHISEIEQRNKHQAYLAEIESNKYLTKRMQNIAFMSMIIATLLVLVTSVMFFESIYSVAIFIIGILPLYWMYFSYHNKGTANQDKQRYHKHKSEHH